jgi:hypothetical protein
VTTLSTLFFHSKKYIKIMAINWRQEADSIINISDLFGDLQRILDTRDILEAEARNPAVEFDENKVVMWVTQDQSNTKLIMGTKVIRLNSINEKNTSKILFWNGTSYEFTEIQEHFLSSQSPYTDGANALNNFLVDASHIYDRVKDCHKTIRGIYYNTPNEFFNTIISSIADYSQINASELLSDRKTLFDEIFKVDNTDKVGTLQRFADAIFSVFNPSNLDETYTYKNSTLIVPLSVDWFMSEDTLKAHYKRVWLSSGALNKMSGGAEDSSGEGISDAQESKENFDLIKTELLRLKKIAQNTSASNTPECLWLNRLTEESLSSIKRIIFIHDGTWNYQSGRRYAEGIALLSTIGGFEPPPLLIVLLHEMNVNCDSGTASMLFFPQGDTHIPPEDTRKIWERCINKSVFEKDVVKNLDAIDDLYQSSRCISALVLAIILSLK